MDGQSTSPSPHREDPLTDKDCRSLTNSSLLIHLFIKELVRAIDWEMVSKQCTWTVCRYGVEVLCTLLCTSSSGKSKASSSLAWITPCDHPVAKTMSLKYKSYREKMFVFDLLLATPLATFLPSLTNTSRDKDTWETEPTTVQWLIWFWRKQSSWRQATLYGC